MHYYYTIKRVKPAVNNTQGVFIINTDYLFRVSVETFVISFIRKLSPETIVLVKKSTSTISAYARRIRNYKLRVRSLSVQFVAIIGIAFETINVMKLQSFMYWVRFYLLTVHYST